MSLDLIFIANCNAEFLFLSSFSCLPSSSYSSVLCLLVSPLVMMASVSLCIILPLWLTLPSFSYRPLLSMEMAVISLCLFAVLLFFNYKPISPVATGGRACLFKRPVSPHYSRYAWWESSEKFPACTATANRTVYRLPCLLRRHFRDTKRGKR